MKYLIPAPDRPYYLWQVLVQAQAFRELGEQGIWIVYYDDEPSPLLRKIAMSGIGDVRLMADWPRERSYDSAMKEWVTARFLADNPEAGPIALYDPDAVPTRPLHFDVAPGILYGSDTDSYTGPKYLKSKLAWEGLCDLVGVDPSVAEQYPGVGAQYVWRDMPAGLWEDVAQLSIRAFEWLKTLPAPEGSNAVQAWCADMFITQLVAIREGWEPRVAPELSMVWANGPAGGWESEGVFHDAGIVTPTPGHFCKLTYQHHSPFFTPIPDISPDSASARYVELIRVTEREWPALAGTFPTAPATSSVPEDDYVRTRTPDLTLLRRFGSEVALRDLARERAALLIFVPSAPTALATSLAVLGQWQAALPRVDVVPVLHGDQRQASGLALTTAPLFDPEGRAAGLFGATETGPSAVLLGADGLLAGGPVHGTDAVAQLVADIAEALEEGEGIPEGRRALVTFVEGDGTLFQQLLALRRSLMALPSADTDIVVMGPEEVLRRLPDDLVKIPQRPACDDPVWRDYRYINSIACLNGAGAERLEEYTHLLRTDVDTFLFPGWDQFRPTDFRWGHGGYLGHPEVHDNIAAVSDLFGLTHRGHSPVGSTWYGPTSLVRRTAALTEMLTRHLVTTEFSTDEGEWPGWYRGVSLLYAGEIAVNHLVKDGGFAPELDAPSTALTPADQAVHVHCWHTDDDFSKHRFMRGGYTASDATALPAGSVARRSLEFSLASRDDVGAVFSSDPAS